MTPCAAAGLNRLLQQSCVDSISWSGCSFLCDGRLAAVALRSDCVHSGGTAINIQAGSLCQLDDGLARLIDTLPGTRGRSVYVARPLIFIWSSNNLYAAGLEAELQESWPGVWEAFPADWGNISLRAFPHSSGSLDHRFSVCTEDEKNKTKQRGSVGSLFLWKLHVYRRARVAPRAFYAPAFSATGGAE